ncbi:MAG: hypothetical protein FJ218_09890 [Ignavibacteria bacterium]|nr:hypothetical protein [Ignavibacteria bacterium]
MTTTLELDQTIYSALRDSFGEQKLKQKVNDIFISGMENLLEKYSNQILHFEEKYGHSFQEFEKQWDNEKIANKHSNEVESDFIDWEMLEAEKKELLSTLKEVNRNNRQFYGNNNTK